MKISLNTILLLAILALAVWYFFFKPVPAAPPVEKTTAPQPPTTIIKEIIKVINGRIAPSLTTKATKVTPINTSLADYSGKVNWKGR